MRLFDLIEYDGASWQVVAQEGPTLSLKNLEQVGHGYLAKAAGGKGMNYAYDAQDALCGFSRVVRRSPI